jgi:predicted dehydrogenase
MPDVAKLRAAVVGAGFIGVVHVDAVRRLGVEVVGVVGSTPERARAKAAVTALPDPYESFGAMLADDRVDVVHLTTPNHLHHGQAKAALEAGKHVVCEKPLALDPSESAELLELADRSRRVVEVLADLVTAIPVRRRPTGEVESFATADETELVDAPMETEDIAHLLVRKELYRAVYAAVADGGMPDEPQFPTFADGHRENVIAEAVARSARERRWIEVWS